MGKQSARLYYDGKDHKDIYFQEKYHEKMYKGSLLVWEKLYPDTYFVGNNKGVITIISKGYADVRNSLRANYRIFFTNSVIAAEFYIGQVSIYVTKDLIHFKDMGENVNNIYGIIKNKFFLREFVLDVGENLEYNKTAISYPNIDDFNKFNGNYFYNFGNYGVLSKNYTKLGRGSYTYLIVNENGEAEVKNDVISISSANESEQDISEKLAMVVTTATPYGYGLKIVFGDYIYYAVNGRYTYYPIGNKVESVSGRIIRRNLLSFEREIVHDFGTPLSKSYVAISFICYTSYEKVVAVCYVIDESDNILQPYVLVINANGDSTLKPITELEVNIYGTNQRIKIIPVRTKKEKEDNSLYLFYNYRMIGGKEYGLDDFHNSYTPSMNNGFVKLGSVNGMAVEFASNFGFGYVYFDNWDFSASENNYVYFIEN